MGGVLIRKCDIWPRDNAEKERDDLFRYRQVLFLGIVVHGKGAIGFTVGKKGRARLGCGNCENGENWPLVNANRNK